MNTAHKHNFAAVILAAGMGTRMRSRLPKVMHKLAGRPLIAHVLASAAPLGPRKTVLVVAPHMESVRKAASELAPECTFAVQFEQLGTGHAVRCALEPLAEYEGDVLVLYGDTPLIRTESLDHLLEVKAQENAAIAMLAMHLADPTGYGRLVMDKEPDVRRIVECKDASAEEKAIPWVWGGIMAFDAGFLREALNELKPSAVTGEYYLTALIEMAAARGLRSIMAAMPVEEAMGINTRAQLAEAERVVQARLRHRAMEQGATLIDPDTVYFAGDTRLGQDVVVHPHVVFGPGVRVADGVEIRSFSHIEGARIEKDAIIGPFARIRPGSDIGEGAHVGNFVELKKTALGRGAKANHLSYVGDAEVGAGANIGAGTITCNYDGVNKYRTRIGKQAFIGSNTSLVAPVTVGDGAMIGAGSVITQDVAANALALSRAPQQAKEGKAQQMREKKAKR